MLDFQKVQDLANKICALQRARRKAKHAKIYEPRSTTASSLGYKCERRSVYARTKPEQKEPTSEELASIFEEGNLHQADVRKELIEIGHEVLEVELPLRDDALEIGARLDGKLAISDEHRAERIPLEIKSCTGPPPETAEKMRDHDGIYYRYYCQMQSYLFLDSTPFGVFIFKDKITGLWFAVVVPLDFEFAEELLKRAERIRDHIKAGTLPDRLEDRSECGSCPFRDSICNPSDADADAMLLSKDEKLLEQIKRREEIQETAKEFEKLDKAIKERFKLTKGDRFVVGDENGFLVTKKKHGKGIRVDFKRLG